MGKKIGLGCLGLGLAAALAVALFGVSAYNALVSLDQAVQAQLEGTENRIAVERMRFNETAQASNTKRMSFPAVMIAGFFGGRFGEKVYFKAQAGADTAPTVKF